MKQSPFPNYVDQGAYIFSSQTFLSLVRRTRLSSSTVQLENGVGANGILASWVNG